MLKRAVEKERYQSQEEIPGCGDIIPEYQKKDKSEQKIPGCGDIILAVWFTNGVGRAVRTFYNGDRDKRPMTFDYILKLAKGSGYKNGIIMLIAESPMDGLVFEYGNHDDLFWYYHGETRGYA